MKALGPCCTWDDFWDGFVRTWQRVLRQPKAEEPAPFVRKRAERYWRVYAMTGYEAAVTVKRELDEGKL